MAADIDLWFRRDVLGPQDMLVDVPHLLMRMPFLLGTKVSDIDHWNRAITETVAPFGMEQKLFDDHLSKAQFKHEMWVSSASFWWPTLKYDEKLNELFFQSKHEDWLDVVFCEDRSVFLARSLGDEEGAPIEFSAEFEGSWGRRHVARIAGIQYAPRSRFAV